MEQTTYHVHGSKKQAERRGKSRFHLKPLDPWVFILVGVMPSFESWGVWVNRDRLLRVHEARNSVPGSMENEPISWVRCKPHVILACPNRHVKDILG